MTITAQRKPLVILMLLFLCPLGHTQQERSQNYKIDPQQSNIYWRVYSAGPLSRLGHNHVISAPEATGSIRIEDTLSTSSFVIEMPVETLVVDDPELRAGLGEDFSNMPSTDDIQGTRRNMLSNRLLDAVNHPLLRVTGSGPLGDADNQSLSITVEIAGTTATVVVPVTIKINNNEVRAEGSFRLTHEQLGLRPFTAMLGTIRVAEPIDFTFSIVALQSN